MIQKCEKCKKWFEDVFRFTSCPHEPFPVNNGNNDFKVYENAYFSDEEPLNKFKAHV